MLTQKRVNELKPDPARGKGGEYWVWERGLGVHVRRSGRVTYGVKYRNAAAVQRVFVIGSADRLTLAEARKAARRVLVDVEKGRDPVEDRRAQRQRGLTVASLAEKWLDTVELKMETRKLYTFNLQNAILPKLGKLSAAKLTPADVRRLYFALKDAGHGTKANRVLVTLGAMLSWAARRDLIPANPAAGAIARQDRAKENEDKRYLSEAEAGRFLAACETLRGEGGHHGRVAVGFLLMLFCGLRPSDVFRKGGDGLKWSEIDWDAGLIRFEEQKAGEEPARLTGPARALLADLDRKKGDKYVFPSHRTGRALYEMRGTWEKVCELAKFDDPRPNPKHLRKTLGSWGRNWGHMAAVGPMLRHAPNGVTEKHYAHADPATVSRDANTIATRLAGLGAAAKVVKLKAK